MLSADSAVVLFVLDIDVAPALHVARVAVVPDILALDDAVRFLVVDGHALVALGVTRLVVEGDVVAVDVSFWRCDSGMAHRPCRARYLVEEALVGMRSVDFPTTWTSPVSMLPAAVGVWTDRMRPCADRITTSPMKRKSLVLVL